MSYETKNLLPLCKTLYALYVLTMFLQMVPQTLLVGFLGMMAALIMTYAKQASAKDTIFESHLKWMLRTFWIGGGVYFPLLLTAACALIIPVLDFDKMTEGIYSGTIENSDQLVMEMMKDNETFIGLTLFATMAPFILWWCVRCWKGYRALKDGKAVEKVMSWL